LLESLTGKRDDIDRGSAWRVKWLSIVVNVTAGIGAIVQLISYISD
jgi:hypothetical protein